MHKAASVLFLASVVAACGGNPSPVAPTALPALSADVSTTYGGAVTHLNTPWGNAVDNSNGGTLLSTAIWTLPIDPAQTQMCPNPPCAGTLPFLNPTQGGFIGDGHFGNPYVTSINRSGNTIFVSYRAVNYNYGWPRPDRPGWETDWYGDVWIKQQGDILVITTRITYCKQGGCDPAVTQDNQLSTIFGKGQSHPDPAERGDFRFAEIRGNEGCILNGESKGVCLSIPNYQSHTPSFGISAGSWPSIAFIQPALERFKNYKVERVESVTLKGFTYSDIPRYRFVPGSWYEFDTLIRLEGK